MVTWLEWHNSHDLQRGGVLKTTDAKAKGGGEYLLDGDRLGKVPWKVDVDACGDGEVVREELERDDSQETLKAVDGAGDTDGLHTRLDVLVVVVANDNGLTFSRCDLHERGLNLGVQRVLGHDQNDGHRLVNESERTVLELTGKDTFRVHVADFLDLKGALETGSVLISSTHDEQGALLGQSVVSKTLEGLVLGKDGLDLVWESMQAVNDGVSSLGH